VELSTILTEWMPVVRKEYLEDFVRKGGSAVKFVVPQASGAGLALTQTLGKESQDSGFLFVALDAGKEKLHLIDKIFHAVAKEVDWDRLATKFLRSTLAESHRIVPDESEDCSLARLAALNNSLDLAEMRRDVNTVLRERLYGDYAMTQEFRIAMLRLCLAQLEPSESASSTATAVKEWLTGDLKLIASLKQAFIFQKINRSNARNMLFSLAHWLHLTGGAGLVLVLDITRFMEVKKPRQSDGLIYYSTAAALDGYEVLRQFVDGTDEMEHGFILVLASPDWLLPKDESPRGVKAYDALWFRMADEVRDRTRVNPLASLIRLADGAAAKGQ